MKNIELISLENVKKVDVTYPKIQLGWKYFKGQEEVVKKRWFRSKIVQEKIEEGWYKEGCSNMHTFTASQLSNYYNFFVKVGEDQVCTVWEKGIIYITYNDGVSYNFTFEDKKQMDKVVEDIKKLFSGALEIKTDC